MYKKPIIVFEGIEGSGKTLHIDNVASYLKKKGAQVHGERQPDVAPLRLGRDPERH